MKKVNLITLWKLNKGSRTPFLGSSEFLAQFPFMEEYLKEYRRIDRDFITQKGFLFPVWNTQYENTNNAILAQFKEDVEDLIFRNKNTYQRLYELTKQEYNPIENYDRMEQTDDTTTDTNTRTSDYGEGMEHFNYGEKTTSNSYGARSQTDTHGAQTETMERGAQSQNTEYGAQNQNTVYGAQSQSTEYGEQNQSTQYGAQSQSTEYGAQNQSTQYGAQSQSTEHGAQTVTSNFGEHNTNIAHGAQSQSMSHGGHTDSHLIGAQSNSSSHRVSGFNSGLTDDSSDTNNIGSRQDSDTIGSYTDTNSSQAYVDSTKDGAHTDTVSNGSYTDTTSNNAHTDTTSNTAHTDTTSNAEHTDTISNTSHTDTTSIIAHTDTTSSTAHTDTTSSTAYTDKNINDEYVDTSAQEAYQDSVNESAKSDVHTTEAKTDTHKDDGKTVYKHEARIHGNIGVTTTAQMIEGERQLWMAFNFYKTIYEDIAKDLCMYVDEGIDAFYAGLNEEGDDMTIGNDKIRATVEQTPNGARITITDSEGTTSADITNGVNGKDGVTPRFKVESDGDIYVDYSGNQEV